VIERKWTEFIKLRILTPVVVIASSEMYPEWEMSEMKSLTRSLADKTSFSIDGNGTPLKETVADVGQIRPRTNQEGLPVAPHSHHHDTPKLADVSALGMASALISLLQIFPSANWEYQRSVFRRRDCSAPTQV